MRILYLPKFAKQYKKLPQKIQETATKKETIFRENPFDQRLRTHKLSGVLAEYWAFSVNASHRIIFDFTKNDTVRFYQIGHHDIYD